MFEYLALTDGTTVVDFTDNIDYALVSYGPVIAPLNDNELGPVYADVQDTITFHARGCTAADAYNAVQAVNALLDQARRWQQGENVSPVVLLALAQGSSRTTPLRAIVKGRAPGGPSNVALPATYNAHADRYVIQNITTQFVRAGVWLDTATESASSATAANPSTLTATLASSVTISSPTVFSIALALPTVPVVDTSIFVLTATAANRIQVYEAESGALGAGITSVADAAAFARAGSVARHTASPNQTSTISLSLASFDQAARRIAVWAAVRNNSSTITWTLRAKARGTGGPSQPVAYGPYVTIAPDNLDPQIVFLGIFATPTGTDTLIIEFAASALSANTFDMDYVIAHAIDDETSSVVALTYPPTDAGPTTATPIVIDPQPLTLPAPTVASHTPTWYRAYQGDARTVTRGQTPTCLVLGVTATYWRLVNPPTVVNTTLTATRYSAYLAPR